MISFKYIAAMLALVTAVGSAQATGHVQNIQIQFMADHELNEVVGAKFDGFSVKDVVDALNSFKRNGVTSLEKKLIVEEINKLSGYKTLYSVDFMDDWLLKMVTNADKFHCYRNNKGKYTCSNKPPIYQ
jgi:hypothetical protein